MSTKRPTMNDIAELAGVSQATVSMVLNQAQSGRVSAETAQRVRDAAAELGYRTNTHAKALREGKSRIIGFIGDEVSTAPFAGGIIKGAQAEAWQAEHVLLTVDTNRDPRLEEAAIEMMLGYQVVGIIYATMYHRVVDLPKGLKGIPTVVVNAQDRALKTPSSFPDEERGGYEAASLLADAGHQRIAMIDIAPESMRLPAAVGRLTGFRAALVERGIDIPREYVVHGTGIHADGLAITRQLMALDTPPTAIFCGNDRTALGCYQALAELGLSIPEDVAVVGFDDQEILTDCFHPGLTTFRLPFEEMGRAAVNHLLDPQPTTGLREAIHCPPVIRGSVTPMKGKR